MTSSPCISRRSMSVSAMLLDASRLCAIEVVGRHVGLPEQLAAARRLSGSPRTAAIGSASIMPAAAGRGS